MSLLRKSLLALLLAGLATDSFAFRCGNQIIALGDTRYEVKALCGDPDDVSTRTFYRSIASNEVVDCEIDERSVASLDEPSTPQRSCLVLVEEKLAVRVDVETWLFDFGRNRFMQQVHFENGRIIQIDKLGYGVKPRR